MFRTAAICVLKTLYNYVVLVARIIRSTFVLVDRVLRTCLIEIGRFIDDLDAEMAATAQLRGRRRRKGAATRTRLRSQNLPRHRTPRKRLTRNRTVRVLDDSMDEEAAERRTLAEQCGSGSPASFTTDIQRGHDLQIAESEVMHSATRVDDSGAASTELGRTEPPTEQQTVVERHSSADVSATRVDDSGSASTELGRTEPPTEQLTFVERHSSADVSATRVDDSGVALTELGRTEPTTEQQTLVERHCSADVSMSVTTNRDDRGRIADLRESAADLTVEECRDSGDGLKEFEDPEPAEQQTRGGTTSVTSETEENEDGRSIADSGATYPGPTAEQNYELRYTQKKFEPRLAKEPKSLIAEAVETLKTLNMTLRVDDDAVDNVGRCSGSQPTVGNEDVGTDRNDPAQINERLSVSKKAEGHNERDIARELSCSPLGTILFSEREESSRETSFVNNDNEIGSEIKAQSVMQRDFATPSASVLNKELDIGTGKLNFNTGKSFTDSESETLQKEKSAAAKSLMYEFNMASNLNEPMSRDSSLILFKDSAETVQTDISGEKNISGTENVPMSDQHHVIENSSTNDRHQEHSRNVSINESKLNEKRPNEAPEIDTENVQVLNRPISEPSQILASDKSPKGDVVERDTDRNTNGTPNKSQNSKSRRTPKAKSKGKQQEVSKDSSTAKHAAFRPEENTPTDDSKSPSFLENVLQKRRKLLQRTDARGVAVATTSPKDSSSGNVSLEHDSPTTRANISVRNREALSPQEASGTGTTSAKQKPRGKAKTPEGQFRTSTPLTPVQDLEALESYAGKRELRVLFGERQAIEDRILSNWIGRRKTELRRHLFEACCTSDHGESSPDDRTSAEEDPSPAKSPRGSRVKGSESVTKKKSEDSPPGRRTRKNALWLDSENVYASKFHYETSCENCSWYDFSQVPDFPPPGPTRTPRPRAPQRSSGEFPPSILDGRSFDVVQQPDGNYVLFEWPAPPGGTQNPTGSGLDLPSLDLSVTDRYLMDEYRDMKRHTKRGFIDSKADATKLDETKKASPSAGSRISAPGSSPVSTRQDAKGAFGGVGSQPLGPKRIDTELPLAQGKTGSARMDLDNALQMAKSPHQQGQGSTPVKDQQAHVRGHPKTPPEPASLQTESPFFESGLVAGGDASTGAKKSSPMTLKSFSYPPPYEAVEGNAGTVLLNTPVSDAQNLVIMLGEPSSGVTGGLFQHAAASCEESAAGQSSRDSSCGGPTEGSSEKRPEQKGRRKKKKGQKRNK